MKRLLIFCALFIIYFPAAAQAQLESNGQVLLTLGRTFAPFTVSESVHGGIYAHTTGFASVRGAAMLFGYIGPELTFKTKTNLKLLTGVWMTKDGGMSTLASVWVNQPLGDFNIFVEGDVYIPMDGTEGHTQRNYYTFAAADWFSSTNKAGFGIAQENFFSENTFDEAAIGPSLIFDKGRIWAAYDFTPEVKDDKVVMLRLVLNL